MVRSMGDRTFYPVGLQVLVRAKQRAVALFVADRQGNGRANASKIRVIAL